MIGVITGHDLIEGGTVLLDHGHLDSRVLQAIEISTPVGEEQEMTITCMGHIDDEVFTRGQLEDGLDAFLAEAEGEMGRFLVESGSGGGGIDFTHKVTRKASAALNIKV